MEIENVDYLLINFEKIPHELIDLKKSLKIGARSTNLFFCKSKEAVKSKS